MTLARFSLWLLEHAIPNTEVRDGIIGDLFEEYEHRSSRSRNPWFAWQAVAISLRYLFGRETTANRLVDGRRSTIGVGTNLRYAVRMLRRRPGFAILTVATLGLGIGATTAIVSVVDRVLLKPLPYPNAHELVAVWNTFPRWRGHEVLDAFWDRVALSYPEYRDWRDGQSVFQEVAIYTTGPATLTELGDPALIGFGTASSSLFPLLGAQAPLGRTFLREEEGAGGALVAVVSHGFWQGRLGGTTDLTDVSVTVDAARYRVVGVLPEGFRVRGLRGMRQTPDVWVPAGIFGNADDRGHHRFEGIARLTAGTSIVQAEADAGPLLRGGGDPDRMGVRVLPRQREEVAAARGPLVILLLAAGVLMVIAAVNVATLFTAEAANRRREFATRSALGASRWQLASQLVFESGAIGLLGAIVGTAVAMLSTPLLLSLAPAELLFPEHIAIDARILVGTAVFGIATGILFGVWPTMFVLRGQASGSLNTRWATGNRTAAKVQRVLIGVESAFAIVLLVTAGLLGRTLIAMQSVDPGFRTDNLVAVSLPLSGPRTQAHLVLELARDLVDRVGALPGVDAVTGASAVPFAGGGSSSSFDIEGRSVAEGEKKPEAHRRSVLPGFHEALGVSVLAGRTIEPADRADAGRVVVVGRALADRYWPDESPIGAFILRDQQRWEVVGVVSDILHSDLTETRQSTFYFPFLQQPPNRFWLVVRTALPPARLIPSIRRTVTAVAPDVALGRVESLGVFVEQSTADARYRAVLVAVFGACALLLAAVGIAGLTARMVTARRRELGIRMALGARHADVTRAVMATEAWPIATGVVVGMVLSAFASRALATFLFGVSPFDVGTFAGAGLILGLVGLVASYLPARRTSQVDAMDLLRAE